ncbi:MAG: FtsQ-type POTRA domain-containing protein [Oscillospiraceae bacterium]|nr:FtsQ-type POTRA domain-containing protein [Oscillospiraceae bacterium]
MTTRQKKKRKNSGARSFVFSSVSFIVICAALVFGMSVFFRVSDIEVIGAGRYTKEEIVAASGLENGDNLMFINREAAAKSVYTKLIYIGDVKVSRKLPNAVVITVSESGADAVIETDSGFWLIDRNCRLLEECATQDADSHVKVKGISAVKPKKGDTVSVAQADEPKLEYLKGILTAVSENGIISDVGSIDLSNVQNAQFDYMEKRFTVKLGADENLDYKFRLLLNVLPKLDADDTGTIDLSQNKKAQFSPF